MIVFKNQPSANDVSIDMSMTGGVPRLACDVVNSELKKARQIRTEFVFASERNHGSVYLCGDWSGWQPIQMKLEKGTLG